TMLANSRQVDDLREEIETQAKSSTDALQSDIANVQEAMEALRASLASDLASQTGTTSSQLAKLAERVRALNAASENNIATAKDQIEKLRNATAIERERFQSSLATLAADTAQTAARAEAPRLNAVRLIEGRSIKFARADVPVAPGAAQMVLMQIANWVQLFDLKVNIIGYSDDVGSPQTNLAVSDQRAKWGADQLIELGVNPTSLSVEALGSQPDHDGNADRQIRFRVGGG
ncbi:MAG: OmpA family protein, partial [Pseudomonadota bacterium]